MKAFFYKSIATIALIAGLVLTTTVSSNAQCAMCRATVESNAGTGSKEPESQVGTGLNTGILYLMVIPYILIGTVGFLWYRSNKKKNGNII